MFAYLLSFISIVRHTSYADDIYAIKINPNLYLWYYDEKLKQSRLFLIGIERSSKIRFFEK